MDMLFICGTIVLIAILVVFFAGKSKVIPPPAPCPTKEIVTEVIETAVIITAKEKRDAALAAREQWFKNNNYIISKILIHKTETKIITVAIDTERKILLVDEAPINFKDIISAAMITSEYQTSTSRNTKNNGIGRAVVGGALAGGAGAVVGAATAATTGTTRTDFCVKYDGIKIYIADILNPILEIYAYNDKRFVEGVHATILAIIAQEQRNK